MLFVGYLGETWLAAENAVQVTNWTQIKVFLLNFWDVSRMSETSLPVTFNCTSYPK